MKSRFVIATIAIFLVLATQACATNIQNTGKSSDEEILFADDFSKPDRWDLVKDADGETNYKDNSYRILVNAQNTDIWANPGMNFVDVRIEVEATKIGGPEDNEFGVICRYKDMNNFYFFAISSDGYFGIVKVKDGKNTLVNRTEMVPSTAIHGGADKNLIRADCVGNVLTFYVNDQLIDQQEDSEFVTGDVGLIAGTYNEAGTEILFDNFKVKRP